MSTYLAEDAGLIRSLLPSAAKSSGDDDALFLGYAVLMRVKGLATTATDVHDTWAAWMLGRDPRHPAIVPFDELTADAQALDGPTCRPSTSRPSGVRTDQPAGTRERFG